MQTTLCLKQFYVRRMFVFELFFKSIFGELTRWMMAATTIQPTTVETNSYHLYKSISSHTQGKTPAGPQIMNDNLLSIYWSYGFARLSMVWGSILFTYTNSHFLKCFIYRQKSINSPNFCRPWKMTLEQAVLSCDIQGYHFHGEGFKKSKYWMHFGQGRMYLCGLLFLGVFFQRNDWHIFLTYSEHAVSIG